jgi:tetratricopeptide (TPR) repeat protein
MENTPKNRTGRFLKIELLILVVLVVFVWIFKTGFHDINIVKGGLKQGTKSAKDQPGNYENYSSKGSTYCDKGEYDQAIQSYTRAIEINPKDADAYFNRGLAHSKKEDYGWAVSDFTMAIEIKPKDAEAYYNRGNVRAKKGEYESARRDYSKAIEINPGNADARNNLKWLLATYLGVKNDDGKKTDANANLSPRPMSQFRNTLRSK